MLIFIELTHGIETDKVNPYIEDCINKEEPLTKVLRLICLQSICNDGLKPKVLEHYKREIIQVYCTEYLLSSFWFPFKTAKNTLGKKKTFRVTAL